MVDAAVAPTGNLTLYLGYATAIATFSAAAAALGLLHCHSRRQRAVSIAVLLLAMLGTSAALIAVAKQHTTGVLNVMIFLGFGATAGYVLFAALRSIFSDPLTASGEARTLVAHRGGDASRRPLLVTFGAFTGALVLLFVAATPSLFSSFFTSRPLAAHFSPVAPSTATPAAGSGPVRRLTYADLCGERLPGAGAPKPESAMLASLWLGGGGTTGAGALAAGCPQRAQAVIGHPRVWLTEGLCSGRLLSVGVAVPNRPPALVFAPAAVYVLTRAQDGTLRGASVRYRVGSGDFYLVDTTYGTVLLIRSRLTVGHAAGTAGGTCLDSLSPNAAPYTVVPPPLVASWLQLVRRDGWLWPVSDRFGAEEPQRLRFVSPQGKSVAAGYCPSATACTLAWNGGRLSSAGPVYTGAAQILSVAP